MSRHFRALALVAATLILLNAAGCAPAHQTAEDDGAPVGVLPTARGRTVDTSPKPSLPAGVRYRKAECPFHQARLRGKRRGSASLGDHVECGFLQVPQVHGPKFNGKTFELAVAIARSDNPNPKPDPVVYLAGGPGGSALGEVNYWTHPQSPLMADRDLILLDQRGTGYSNPTMWCRDEDYRRGSNPDDPGPAADACFKRQLDRDVNPNLFSTAESADDVADLRAALGYTEWNVLGVSYGTRLALSYMREHPEGIRSVILDSVYPAGVKLFEEAPTNAANAMDALWARCAADPACNAKFPNLQERFLAAIDRLDKNPARALTLDPQSGRQVSVVIDGETLVDIVFGTLYDTAALPSLPHAIDLIAKGAIDAAIEVLIDPPSARARSDQQAADPPPSFEAPAMNEGLYFSIQCAEEAPADTIEAANSASAGIREPLKHHLLEKNNRMFAICEKWKVSPKDPQPTASDIPTLVLAGGLDPITPVAWSEQAAKGLSRSTLRVFPDAGHAVINGGPCAQKVMTSFLSDPTTSPDQCQPDPIEFDLG